MRIAEELALASLLALCLLPIALLRGPDIVNVLPDTPSIQSPSHTFFIAANQIPGEMK